MGLYNAIHLIGFVKDLQAISRIDFPFAYGDFGKVQGVAHCPLTVLFIYKLFKIYFFCEIEKVSKRLKCNVLVLKRKTKSHKTTKCKHVITLVTINGLPEKLKL